MTRREGAALGLILVAYAAVASIQFRDPFVHCGEGNCGQVGKHAKNFLWHGWAKTRGIMLDTSGPRLDLYPRYQDHFYPDHPPLPDLALAGMFALLGPHEWVVRLQGHLFALGCLILFFFLVRHWYTGPTSVPATALLALLPMFAYFSSVTVHQVPTLFFILGGLLAYSHRKWGSLVLFQFLACYSDWPGYYLAVVVFVHLGFVERRWKIAWIFPALNVAIFGVYLLHVYAADPTGGALRRLWEVARSRSSPIPILPYLRAETWELGRHLTLAGMACAIGWAVSRLWRRSNGDRFFLCLPFLALDELWLQTICFYNDYYSYFLAPFVAVAAARALLGLWERKLAVLATLLAAMIGLQSAFILYRRKTLPSPHELQYRLGSTVRRMARPDEKVLCLLPYDPLYTPFYSERFVARLDLANRLSVDYADRGRSARLEELLASSEYAWAVAAQRDAVVANAEFFGGLRSSLSPDEFDRAMRRFGVGELSSATLELLDRAAVERTESGGFIFFKLRKP